MNLAAPFIARPVATTLLTVGITLAGIFAFFKLPVSPLPQVDFPTISVQAQLPGASPDTVATSVAEPLERHLGQIADVTEMTSTSAVGQTRIVLQFGLDRDINGAARDVEAAINAARADLPTSLRSNPTYRKVNPADAPILILSLTSKTLTRGQIYDAATNVFSQSLSQLPGIGQVIIGGAALPAVRVELNPTALNKYGIGLEDVRAALASANADSPKGAIEADGKHYQLYTNDQATHAADYKPLVIAYRNGAAVRLSDMGEVLDSVENLRNLGLSQGKPAVLVILFRQPGANIISTVDAVKAAIPQLMEAMPRDMDVSVAIDRTITIRSSLHDTELTLLIAVGLVTLVVFLFLRSARATLIPAVAVPVSIIGTFGTMYLLGYSLDNLSLMALTVATGFVVDDAIVVLENISRHLEEGMPRVQAALQGAKEVGFTVVSISVSLIAVFLPDPAHGRHRRTAVPGVRQHAVPGHCGVAGDLADDDADDVRDVPSPGCRQGSCGQSQEEDPARAGTIVLWADVGLVAAPRAARHAGAVCNDCAELRPFHSNSKRILPATGHRPDDGRAAGRPEHLLSGNGNEAEAVVRYRATRSGGAERGRLHRPRQRRRREPDQYRPGLRRAEAPVAT